MTTPGFQGRHLRRLSLSMVPAPQRAWLRHAYESLSTPSMQATGSFSAADGEICSIELPEPVAVRFVPESRDGIECHFRDAKQAAELAAFWRYADRPGVLFDVGAANGLFSCLYCMAHGQNRAVAFEPSPELARRAESNARLNGIEDRHTVICKAVADTAGRRDMKISLDDGYTQPAEYAGTESRRWRVSTIDSTTLELEARKYLHPSVIKIDVEGSEWEVLQGARSLLARARPLVFLELHLNFLEQRGISPIAVLGILAEYSYDLYRISGRPITAARAARSWASVLHLIAQPAERRAHMRPARP